MPEPIHVLSISEDTLYNVRASEIERMATERARIAEVITAAEQRTIPERDIPSDIHTYYGQRNKLDEQLSQLRIVQGEYGHARYNDAMDAVKAQARTEERTILSAKIGPHDLDGLQRFARMELEEIRARSWDVPDASISKWLSNDDHVFAYRVGAKAELQQWYFEQKREYGLGRGTTMEPERTPSKTVEIADTKDIAKAIVDSHILGEHKMDIIDEANAFVANSALHVGAARNYLRGRMDEFNRIVEDIREKHPEFANELPLPIRIDEISVREMVLHKEQRRDEKLSIAV